MAYNRFLLSAACLFACLPAYAQPVGAGNDSPAVPVTVVKPVRQDVPITIPGLAQVSPLNNIVLHPRVDGTLDKVNFVEGSMVHAGDVLAVIDPRPYQAALDSVMAKKASDVSSQTNAKRDLERYSQLAVNQFAAQQQVDTQRALVTQLEATIKGDDAAIAAAQLNLDFTKITAPFDGRVGLRLTDLGAFIRAADATNPGIVTLSQIQPVTVTFSVPQDNLPKIAAAMAKATPKVQAISADGKSALGDGTLVTIDNSIDPTTGTIKAKATFPNGELKLWPGQFVNTIMQVGQESNVLALPSQAVQHGPNGLFIYVVKPDHTVAVSPVDVALDTGTLAAITSGVSEGDTVVLAGQSRLRPGAKVSITTGSGS